MNRILIHKRMNEGNNEGKEGNKLDNNVIDNRKRIINVLNYSENNGLLIFLDNIIVLEKKVESIDYQDSRGV